MLDLDLHIYDYICSFFFFFSKSLHFMAADKSWGAQRDVTDAFVSLWAAWRTVERCSDCCLHHDLPLPWGEADRFIFGGGLIQGRVSDVQRFLCCGTGTSESRHAVGKPT